MPPERPRYSASTTDSPFSLKRWLHRRRFAATLRFLQAPARCEILDYGCGDGYFLALLRKRLPTATLTGFDPFPNMARQAREQLAGLDIQVIEDLRELGNRRFDRIACLETCEHLIEPDLRALLHAVRELLTPSGRVLFSVPVEIGLPALVKDVYRLFRRRGYENLSAKTILRATFGLRQTPQISHAIPGREYIFSHIGFDHRRFERSVSECFQIERRIAIPLPWLGPAFGNTLLYDCRPLDRGSASVVE